MDAARKGPEGEGYHGPEGLEQWPQMVCPPISLVSFLDMVSSFFGALLTEVTLAQGTCMD